MEIKSSVFYKKGTKERVTLIEVSNGYEQTDDGRSLSDVFYQDYCKPLFRSGWSQLIETSVEIPSDCGLTTGVTQVPGEIDAAAWASRNSNYEWVHERMTTFEESVGFGNLPGRVGSWRRKA